MKAFLSYSSHDKEFVQAVAKELGRQFCVVDEQAFRSGDEFKVSIERDLDKSSVFVLFASRSALKSIWVEFEIEEAWFRRLNNNLWKSLVYLIDSNVDIGTLPEWLRRALVRQQNSPKAVARDIRHHLDELLRQRQHSQFVGRSHNIDQLEQALTPLDGAPPPRAIFVSGLPGIGRRSLIKQTAPSILSLRKYVEIRIGESDSINDICIRVSDHIEPYSTNNGFHRIVQEIKNLSDEKALQRTLTNLRTMVEANELPIFFDQGGLLDSDGYIRQPIRAILVALTPNDSAYIFFVSNRRPQRTPEISIPVVHLGPLGENETRRLITMLASQDDLQISPSQVSEVAEYVAGYPPAAYFAIEQAKNYGIEIVMRDKGRLVEFRTNVFLQYFARISLNDNEQCCLRLLATYSPLPLPVLARVLTIDPATLDTMVVRLIDLALVIMTEDGYYRIADPVTVAAVNVFGFPHEDQSRALAQALSEFLATLSDIRRLEISRALFLAAKLVNDDAAAAAAVHLASDLIQLVETFYHARRYGEAVKAGYAAAGERPESVRARSYLIRALIQEEKWHEATAEIQKLQKYASLRDVYFLIGFLERKRCRLSEAIKAYKESERLGKWGAAISRELALCHFLAGNQVEADRYIQNAIQHHSDNPFLVDLWAQIATHQRDEAGARKALNKLEIINKPLYYNHRLSRIELAFGRLPEARTAALRAVKSEELPPFEVLAQLIYCDIELGNLTKAAEFLTRLDQEHRNVRRDIRIGLRCRLEIALGHYREALSQSDRIRDKTTFFYKKIKKDALDKEIKNSALKDSVRASYKADLSSLEKELAGITAEKFIPTELDNLLRTNK